MGHGYLGACVVFTGTPDRVSLVPDERLPLANPGKPHSADGVRAIESVRVSGVGMETGRRRGRMYEDVRLPALRLWNTLIPVALWRCAGPDTSLRLGRPGRSQVSFPWT